tara:strand:- start:8950 stop:9504 length:555 start_codon:yes stop_codon:yes gene_type:complete
MSTNTTEPNTIYIGNTLEWEKTFNDYLATKYTLTYYFRGLTGSFNIVASANVDAFSVSVSSSTTGNYIAGNYDWEARVSETNGDEVYSLSFGRVEVKKSLSAQSSGYDPRSHSEKLLDTIKSVLEGSIKKADVQSFSIGGRSISKISDPELVKLRNKLSWEVYLEKGAENLNQNRPNYSTLRIR